MSESEEIVIRIRRVKDRDVLTCLSYPVGDALDQWRPQPDKKEFSVSAVVASEAIKSGYFELVPEKQQTTLKPDAAGN
jgi:hypothetical protein